MVKRSPITFISEEGWDEFNSISPFLGLELTPREEEMKTKRLNVDSWGNNSVVCGPKAKQHLPKNKQSWEWPRGPRSALSFLLLFSKSCLMDMHAMTSFLSNSIQSTTVSLFPFPIRIDHCNFHCHLACTTIVLQLWTLRNLLLTECAHMSQMYTDTSQFILWIINS